MVGDFFLQAKHAQGGTALAGAVESRGQYVDHHLLGERRRVDDHRVHAAGFRDKRRRTALRIKAVSDVALQQRRYFGRTGKHYAANAFI